MEYRVRRAGLDDAQEIGELFNQYRMFYNQVSDTERAIKFIQERLSRMNLLFGWQNRIPKRNLVQGP